MTAAQETPAGPFPAHVENAGAGGRVVLVCEHASNTIPAAWGDLGLTEAQRHAHIAWDPGALGLARGLMRRLDAVLVHAPVSRLVYDCNRAPDMAGAMPARSEVHDIPGNQSIGPAERHRRTQAIYLPFHDALHGCIAGRIALGLAPVMVTIHSFTPVYFDQPRAVEFGVIHDHDPTLARAVVEVARERTGLRTELNAPYSAADDVTHSLRLHATPYALQNVMLEIRNDLIATPAAEEAMAEILAPVLTEALARISLRVKAG
ncbi:N-formylglutamate amidohydrolase [Aliigemmobacter aestuarii]|uniref:N-formylglutamate amidohydrolase n=1 Tax=Aliigemmobacter aestuarii TaxID=1445661 RepID=A0A4S3ML40_9RHOB|nr:N-formylglutamate amidohydrolase [Gemmobacter aestuarii]THD81434.1 N-formylglutamate amidohydrolase [Gemmobacter aestuarii]